MYSIFPRKCIDVTQDVLISSHKIDPSGQEKAFSDPCHDEVGPSNAVGLNLGLCHCTLCETWTSKNAFFKVRDKTLSMVYRFEKLQKSEIYFETITKISALQRNQI